MVLCSLIVVALDESMAYEEFPPMSQAPRCSCETTMESTC